MIARTKVAIAAAAVVVVAGTSVAIASATKANADEGTVIQVIDGDTLLVDFDHQELTVRLLNVDTPETKDPDQPVQCLGPEATDFLTGALPAGSTVSLEFDVEREDQDGRTLAAVYDDGNRLINAEVARQGLGIPVTFGKNAKFRPPVDAAFEEARDRGAGLFGLDGDCTVPAMVGVLEDTAAQAAAEPTGSTALTAAAAATAVLALAQGVDDGFDALEAVSRDSASLAWAVFSDTEKAAFLDRAALAKDTIHSHYGELITLQQQRQFAEDEAVRQAAEAEQLAAEEAARAEADRLAAEQAEAERLAEEEQQQNPQPPSIYAPPPSVLNPYPGYTGPRCYEPGGQSWRPC